MAVSVEWAGAEDERRDRVVKAILDDAFREAAEAYADCLIDSDDTGEIVGIAHLMRLRERFMNARLMQAEA